MRSAGPSPWLFEASACFIDGCCNVHPTSHKLKLKLKRRPLALVCLLTELVDAHWHPTGGHAASDPESTNVTVTLGLGQTSFESRSRCPTSKACTALQRHWQLQPKSRSLGSDSSALQCGSESGVSFPLLLTTRKMGFLLAGPASAGAPFGCGACNRPQESCAGTPGRLNHPNLRWLPEPGPRVGSRPCTLLWLRHRG